MTVRVEDILEAADMMHISRQQMLTWLKDIRASNMGSESRHDIDMPTKDAVVKAFEDGLTVAAISRQENLPTSGVQRILRERLGGSE